MHVSLMFVAVHYMHVTHIKCIHIQTCFICAPATSDTDNVYLNAYLCCLIFCLLLRMPYVVYSSESCSVLCRCCRDTEGYLKEGCSVHSEFCWGIFCCWDWGRTNQPELQFYNTQAKFLLVPSNPDCCKEIPRSNPGDSSALKKL